MRSASRLSLGVTGHRPGRRLPDSQLPRVIAEATSIIARLTAMWIAELCGPVTAPRDLSLSLVSSLAEGADRIAAQAAINAGWRLEVALPFEADAYEEDFTTTASRAEFRCLLAKASSVSCLAMPTGAAHRPRGYEAASLAMLDRCHLLLAIWDGEPGRGLGGTAETVAHALRRGMAVIHVDPVNPLAPVLLVGNRRLDPETDLAALLASLLVRRAMPSRPTRGQRVHSA